MSNDQCDLCVQGGGIYSTANLCCCLRLLQGSPPGDARRAMAVHLRASLSHEAWQELVAAAEERGLLARPASASSRSTTAAGSIA
jgi:hypothetical protein